MGAGGAEADDDEDDEMPKSISVIGVLDGGAAASSLAVAVVPSSVVVVVVVDAAEGESVRPTNRSPPSGAAVAVGVVVLLFGADFGSASALLLIVVVVVVVVSVSSALPAASTTAAAAEGEGITSDGGEYPASSPLTSSLPPFSEAMVVCVCYNVSMRSFTVRCKEDLGHLARGLAPVGKYGGSRLSGEGSNRLLEDEVSLEAGGGAPSGNKERWRWLTLNISKENRPWPLAPP